MNLKNEKELFKELRERSCKDITKQLKIPYDGVRYFSYDISYKNKLIEYNGDFWHSNPLLYEENFVNPISKRSAKYIWKNDARKRDVALSNGYELLVIWESDYNDNPEKEIQKCLEFLNE